jgi:hypothetical protein
VPDDDVRVPAGWYPDPLGLPQLRWWDNHAWTEHISDARQPMTATETVTTKLAYADDEPSYESDYASDSATDTIEQDLSRRERRERERLADEPAGEIATQPAISTQYVESEAEAEAGQLDPVATTAAFAEPLRSLEAPERDQLTVDEPSPAVRLASAGAIEDAPTSAPFEMDTRFDDLLGETSIPRSAFAHVGESATAFVPTTSNDTPPEPDWAAMGMGGDASGSMGTAPAADTGRRVVVDVSTNTGPAWIITLIPLYMLVTSLLLLLSGAGTPTYVSLALLFGVPYLAGFVLAFLDWRQLRESGLEQPANFAWALLGPLVYMIVRLTRTVRESGTGFGPMLTFIVLGVAMLAASVAVPGLIIQLSPDTFSQQAAVSIDQSASILGTDLVAECPPTPPLIPQQSFVCQAHKPGGATYDVTVSLQRSNGWIDWRVDDWGVFSATS